MNEQQWQQAREIFEAAVELNAAAQSGFLAQACAHDAAVRAQVEGMLIADRQDSPLLDQPLLYWEPTQSLTVRETAPEASAALPFAYVGAYRLLSLLGQGGMGEVYAAWDEKLGRRVALKLMKAGLEGQYLKRFDEERTALARLNHPNIVTIYDGGQSGDRPFLVMEFLTGQSLKQRMQQGRIQLAEITNIVRQTCAALNAAHGAGIVHRDLKPDNLYLAQNADGLLVKVLDFGVAALRDGDTLTQTLQVLGTPAYLSPEQALGKNRREIDHRADLYSLGVILYEMLTGERMFTAGQRDAYLHLHAHVTPPPPSQRAPNVAISTALDALVMRAIAKHPAERFDSARDFARIWQEVADRPVAVTNAPETSIISYDTQVRPPGKTVPTNYVAPATQPMEEGKTKLWLAVTLVMFVVLLAVGGWMVYRQTSRVTPPPVATHPVAEPKPTASVIPPATHLVAGAALEIERLRQGVGKVPLNDAVRSGDQLRFAITPSATGRLYLMQVGTNGEIDVPYVYPQPVMANRQVTFPANTWLGVRDDTGTETLYFILVKQVGEAQLSDLEQAIQQKQNNFAPEKEQATVRYLESLIVNPGLSAKIVVRKVVLQHQR
ncbi:MAG: protein kinase [Acidobacteria bacterium]|nr:protein kinase [Acidobacteriota bacterium]